MANLGAILSGVGRLRTGTTQVSKDYPDLAAAATVTSGGGVWSLGAYSQIVAATVIPQSALLGLSVLLRLGASVDIRFEIATGGAGVEVVVARVRGQMFYDTTAGMQQAVFLPTPLTQIAANARLSVRSAAAAATQAFTVALLTVPTPL